MTTIINSTQKWMEEQFALIEVEVQSALARGIDPVTIAQYRTQAREAVRYHARQIKPRLAVA